MERDNLVLLHIFKNQADFKVAVMELRASLQALQAAIVLHIESPEARKAFLEAIETMQPKILEAQPDYKLAKAASEMADAQLRKTEKPFPDA